MRVERASRQARPVLESDHHAVGNGGHGRHSDRGCDCRDDVLSCWAKDRIAGPALHLREFGPAHALNLSTAVRRRINGVAS